MAERMPGFFDVEERLRELSAKGDDLERVKALWISRYSGRH
jgi:transposase, IS5 family